MKSKATDADGTLSTPCASIALMAARSASELISIFVMMPLPAQPKRNSTPAICKQNRAGQIGAAGGGPRRACKGIQKSTGIPVADFAASGKPRRVLEIQPSFGGSGQSKGRRLRKG